MKLLQRVEETPPPEAFAARAINPRRPTERKYLRTVIDRNRARLRNAWDWYERLGEVHYGVSRSARLAGYTRYIVKRRDGRDPDPAAVVATEGLYSRFGGSRGLLERYYTCMKVPGDCYLIRLKDDQGNWDGLHFASASELEFDDGDRTKVRWITMPATAGEYPNDSQSADAWETTLDWNQFLGRVWLAGKQYIDLPDTPMLALQSDCEALFTVKQSIQSRIAQRLLMDGIMFFPSSLTHIQHPFGGVPKIDQPTGSKFLDGIIYTMQVNRQLKDRGLEPTPIIVAGPPEAGDAMKHITLDSQIFETDLKYHAQLLENILQGLDVQKRAVLGVEEANHWGAWMISDEERRVSVQPDMETAGWAFMRLYIIPEMRLAGVSELDIAQHYLEADLNAAAVKSNMQEDGRQAFDRGAVGFTGLRRMSGIPDEDAADGVELIRQAGVIAKDPYLMTFDLPEAEAIDWTKTKGAKPGPPGSPADDAESGPGQGDPGSPDDQDTDIPRTQRPG